MKETVVKRIEEDAILNRIRELAEEINRDYEGKKLHLVCVLKGGVYFACELSKHLTMPVTIDFMSLSSYGDGMTSQGVITMEQDLTQNIAGKDVLLVEDIIDSGQTLYHLMETLRRRMPASLKLCTLLDKKERRIADVSVDDVIRVMGTDKGSGKKDIEKALAHYGILQAKTMTRADNSTPLPPVCILKVLLPKYSHWVLYYHGKYW